MVMANGLQKLSGPPQAEKRHLFLPVEARHPFQSRKERHQFRLLEVCHPSLSRKVHLKFLPAEVPRKFPPTKGYHQSLLTKEHPPFQLASSLCPFLQSL